MKLTMYAPSASFLGDQIYKSSTLEIGLRPEWNGPLLNYSLINDACFTYIFGFLTKIVCGLLSNILGDDVRWES